MHFRHRAEDLKVSHVFQLQGRTKRFGYLQPPALTKNRSMTNGISRLLVVVITAHNPIEILPPITKPKTIPRSELALRIFAHPRDRWYLKYMDRYLVLTDIFDLEMRIGKSAIIHERASDISGPCILAGSWDGYMRILRGYLHREANNANQRHENIA